MLGNVAISPLPHAPDLASATQKVLLPKYIQVSPKAPTEIPPNQPRNGDIQCNYMFNVVCTNNVQYNHLYMYFCSSSIFE